MAQQPTCKVCRQIRYFFLVAVPILVLIGTRTDVAVPAIPIEELFTWFIVIAFLLIVAFRVYKDYFSSNK